MSERERASELTSNFDVWAPKMTTSSMLGRHWTECLLPQFDRLEVSLA